MDDATTIDLLRARFARSVWLVAVVAAIPFAACGGEESSDDGESGVPGPNGKGSGGETIGVTPGEGSGGNATGGMTGTGGTGTVTNPIIGPDADEICRKRLNQCGLFDEAGAGIIDCGECESGEFCVYNQCQPKCGSDLLEGPSDSLAAHVYLRLSPEDVGPNDLDVEVGGVVVRNWRPENWKSQTDVSEKLITIPTTGHLTGDVTVSVRLLPETLTQDGVIFTWGNLEVRQQGSDVALAVGSETALHPAATLRQFDCNHIAVRVGAGMLSLVVNGNEFVTSIDVSSLSRGDWSVGNYPGRIWDLRAYERTLSLDEVRESAGLCIEDRIGSNLVTDDQEGAQDYYQCGAFWCHFYPTGTVGTGIPNDSVTQDELDYNLVRHDEAFERNILLGGLYPDGELCAYLKERGETDNHRFGGSPEYAHSEHAWPGDLRGWVRGRDWDNPAEQHWLHENYHSYQGMLISWRSHGTMWFRESTASWGAFFNRLDAKDDLIGYYTFQAHAPLYISGEDSSLAAMQSPFAESEIARPGGHQYGSAIFLAFLGRHVLGPAFIHKWVNHDEFGGDNIGNVHALYDVIEAGGYDPADVFIDFAARNVTWDYYGYDVESHQRNEHISLARLMNEAMGDGMTEDQINKKFVAEYDVSGTSGSWVTVPSAHVPGNWAYNTYSVDANTAGSYSVGIRTSASNISSVYRATLVTHNTTTDERTYTPLALAAPGVDASATVEMNGADKLYVVFASFARDWAPGDDWVPHYYDINIAQQ